MSKFLHKTAVVWFRNDLRLHDNISLSRAIESAETIIPVYVFDERFQTAHSYSRIGSFPRAGLKRLRFVLESVEDLKNSLISVGSDLLVVVGHTEQEIEKVVNETGATLVVGHKEVTSEEIGIEKKLFKKYNNSNVLLEFLWDNTMYHLDDLPFTLKNIPNIYTSFRKQVESKSQVRAPLPTPTALPPFTLKNIKPFPTLIDLGITEEEINNEIPNKSELQFKGGEKAGLQRMQDYFFTNNCLREYKETRNGLLGANYSSKFSSWLAYGCLSPRTIYANVKKYESQVVENQSTYWMLFELLWRDYFKFWVYKVGNTVFQLEGPNNRKDLKWKKDADLFHAWASGTTGFPFIDACMRELNATGFMSNRGRQNVCSFIARDMGLDWRLGAEYFENRLIDYDVCSNWGNWVYGTGVGNDPREDRYFNIIKQASVYDPKGEFVKFWCPELANVPVELLNTPWKMSALEQKKYKCEVGTTYPKPIVKLIAGMNSWTGSKKQFR